ncbi:uncharacterized protein LOC113340867 [Papaver somniferum]|uniref:uncharacterized protein LOC113340867 n=1 Tax=Papaver somniferum TaxID=3469 RepID=UPI000E6FBD31|nr:uncharacterized protein LOC113340867 [Papaver somniferum]
MQYIFKKLWKLPVLPRIAQFICKCLKDILQTRDKLVYVIHNGDYGCLLCSQALETSSHCILHCNLSRAVWFAVLGLHIQADVNPVDWFCEWFDRLKINQIQEEYLCKIAITAWSIWNARCDSTFKGWKINPDSIIMKSKLEIELLKPKNVTIVTNNARQRRTNLHCSPPAIGTHKINVDGSFSYSTKMGGMGLILRDFARTHRGSKCIFLGTALSQEQVECKGLWEALLWAEDMKLDKVIFELDSQLVADAVNRENFNTDWRIYNVILDIKSMLKNKIFWKCNYVPKEKNKVADILANLARVSLLSSVWILSITDEIVTLLQENAQHVTQDS